jgi:hypothetical protein
MASTETAVQVTPLSPTQSAPVQQGIAQKKAGGKGRGPEKTSRRIMENLETSMANGATMHFKACFSAEAKVRVSAPAAAVLADIVNKVVSVILDKSRYYVMMANKRMLSADIIKIAAQTCVPASVTATSAQSWRKIFNSDAVWQVLDRWTENLKALRKKNTGAQQQQEPVRINDIVCEAGHHIKPTVMKRLISRTLAKTMKVGGDRPAIALVIVCGVVIEMIARAIHKERSDTKKAAGFIVAPKHIIRAIQANEVLRAILGELNMVGAPVGLLERAGKRRRRVSVKSKKFGRAPRALRMPAGPISSDEGETDSEGEEDWML